MKQTSEDSGVFAPDPLDYKINIFEYTIQPGIGYNYFLSQNVSLEAVFSYAYNRRDGKNDTRTVESRTNALQLAIGVQVFLD